MQCFIIILCKKTYIVLFAGSIHVTYGIEYSSAVNSTVLARLVMYKECNRFVEFY